MGAASPIVGAHPTPRNISRPIILAHEIPMDFADSFEGIVRHVERATGILPAIGWQAGNDNAPAYWLGAPNAIDRFAVTGTPDAVTTPWVEEDGTAIPAEEYWNECRSTGTGNDPLATEDIVCAILFRAPTVMAVARVYYGTRIGGRGYWIYTDDVGKFVWFTLGAGAVASTTAGITPGGLYCAVCVHDTGGNMWHHLNDSAPLNVIGAAAGLVGAADGVGIAATPAAGLRVTDGGRIIWASSWYGVGIADLWAADTNALTHDVFRRAMGMERRTGHAGSTFARNSARSRQDRNARWFIMSPGMPRCGDAVAAHSGIQLAPARTNKSYANINVTVAGAAAWTVDDASAVARVDDSAALAAAAEPAEDWGPWVCEYNNATGANRYMYIPGNTGNVNAHSLSVIARIVAGAGPRLGLWDVSLGAFTNLGAITDGHVRTIINNVTPGDNDERLCIMLPNGCHLRWIAHQLEEGDRATTPIPNFSAVAGAAAAAEVLTTPWTPADGGGGYEIGITPMNWSNGDVAVTNYVIDRSGGAFGYLLYLWAGVGRWRFSDFTNNAEEAVGTAADGVRQVISASWGGNLIGINVDGTRVVNVYDGTISDTGTLTLQASAYELSIDNLKCLRRMLP